MLATLVPTVLMTALGIALLAGGSSSVRLVIGLLVVTFCTTSITGYILGSIFVSRGASMARVQSDFLSGVSHELRTPLTSIRMFIETLRDDRLTDPVDKRQCLDLLNQEVGRLEGLVERLLELSRIETGKHDFHRDPVPIDDVVSDALTAFDVATLTSNMPMTFDVNIEPDLVVTGDRAALGQAVINLLTNAWKYTPDKNKHIQLTARTRGDKWVEIAVSDNGPGIPRDERKQIFDKFERGKDAIDSRKGGVGLGLATVRAIIRAHKGRVEVHSRVGHGSEFRIILRRRSAGEAPRAAAGAVSAPSDQP